MKEQYHTTETLIAVLEELQEAYGVLPVYTNCNIYMSDLIMSTDNPEHRPADEDCPERITF